MTHMNALFSKETSKALKGLLVVLMFWSHMFNHPDRLLESTEWFSLFEWGGITIEVLLVPLFHVAVPCFFFIAGYGYYISNKSQKRSIGKQVLGLYVKYWIVFIIFIPLCTFLGKISITPSSLFLNLVGLSSSYCGEWWFLSTYIEILVIFHAFEKLINRFNVKTRQVLVVSIVASFAGYSMNVLSSRIGLDMSNLIVHEVHYFLIKQPMFVMGWSLAKIDYINCIEKIMDTLTKYTKLIVFALLWLVVLVLQYVQSIPETYLYMIYLPLFVYMFSKLYQKLPVKVCKMFEILGRYSTYMWLCHSILLYKLIQKFIYFPRISLLCWGNLIILSFVCSYVLTRLEKILCKSIKVLK